MAKPNREMRRAMSKRSHSWWWDSHISPKNSKWLAENLEEMDQSVKRMLKLIEEEGDSFAKKAEMYYQKRPELISHVEEFYRMYRSLAERYDHLTGELRKNIPSELQSQGSGSDFGSEPSSPSPTPDQKPTRPKPRHRAAGFDFFLGSGGSSDLSRKGSDGSSSSTDSESESDEASSKNPLLGMLENGGYNTGLHRRISELENELKDVKDKLQAAQEEKSGALSKAMENGNYDEYRLKISNLEQELTAANEKIRVSKEEIVMLKQELEKNDSSERIRILEAELESSLSEKQSEEAELELAWKEKESEEARLELARKHNDSLVAELELEKKQTSELQGRIAKLVSDISDRDRTIQELRAAIDVADQRFSEEKAQLKNEVSGLLGTHASMEAKLSEWAMRGQLMSDEIAQLEAEKLALRSEIELANAENAERRKRMEEMGHDLDAVRLKYDMMVLEKDEVCAKAQSLVAEVSSRDDRIREMDSHLHRLHMEHAELIAGFANAEKLMGELQARVKELEEEVERQRIVISDNAEGKREAIRQLCLSIEHYRDSYHELRQALHGHRRPATVMAA
ncbi:protein NETWORKED 4B [Magnolia sinica]|uniref:protein NETWORKED 4B n=1 Tax=Magnolia sinica TaxID=86752 RepID=UPI00265A1D85|nr:protein NETWORKED 4B [Magnolia sinica]XP_058110689.1 protein NETWORKED 4B [Magnolia sinica]XP_058110690.1 protein NETWORKED 4B [Magnolia sinica]